MLSQKEIERRARKSLASAKDRAEYLRIWRARFALGLPTRRESQQSMMQRRKAAQGAQ